MTIDELEGSFTGSLINAKNPEVPMVSVKEDAHEDTAAGAS